MGGKHHKGVAPASKTSIEVRFYLDRKLVREYVPIKPTKTALESWEKKRTIIIEEIKNDRFDYSHWFPFSKRAPRQRARAPSNEITIETILETWLEDNQKTLELTSWKKCRSVADHILIPTFGGIPANEFTIRDLLDWYRTHNLTRKTISNYLWPLRQAFEHAFHVDESIPDNPLANYKVQPRRIDKQKRAEKSRNADPFIDKEIQATLKKAQQDLVPFVLFNIWTGLRLEEMFALQWEDVDKINNRIHVKRARVGLIIKGTKTACSTRYVTLLPKARQALDLVKPISFLKGENIFTCLRSSLPWRQESLRLAWKRTCIRASVRYRPAKHFRHTYAHRLLTAGEELAYISREMGHKNCSVTAQVYAGILDDIDRGDESFGRRVTKMYD